MKPMYRFAVAALAASLALAGCAGPPVATGGGTITIPLPTTGPVASVISYVRGACGFELAFDTAVALIGTFVPGTAIASTIGNMVCSALTAKSARRGAAADGSSVPVVRGVPIYATYVGR